MNWIFALMTTAAWLPAAAFDLPSEVAKQNPLNESCRSDHFLLFRVFLRISDER